ncbi:MAG: hypothetical protein KBT04_00360, partial [Bacteroidales bacterium]|nr:hypothetical protein [Candidatus Colimorpha onthohippi]
IYTIADFAFAIAANSRCVADNRPFEWVSLSADIHYLAAASLGNIEACCRCLHIGGRTAVFETLVSDARHHVFAKVTTTGMKI